MAPADCRGSGQREGARNVTWRRDVRQFETQASHRCGSPRACRRRLRDEPIIVSRSGFKSRKGPTSIHEPTDLPPSSPKPASPDRALERAARSISANSPSRHDTRALPNASSNVAVKTRASSSGPDALHAQRGPRSQHARDLAPAYHISASPGPLRGGLARARGRRGFARRTPQTHGRVAPSVRSC